MDTFPFEDWEEAIRAAQEAGLGYFTWGPGWNLGTVLMVVIGFLVMVAAFWAWFATEDAKLRHQAQRVRGMFGEGS